MCHFRTVIIAAVLGALAAAGNLPGGLNLEAAENFRVDNTVYVDNQKAPVCRSATIFHDGVVYDCMKTPAETVVFDKSAGRFVLLNLKSRTRTELTTGEVAAFTDRLQQLAVKSSDPLVKFLAAPKFQERFDETTGKLTLSSPLVSYRLTLAPEKNQAVVEQYHEFSDWYARLNALLTTGSRPPFGRLVVNAALAKHKATASQVILTLSSGKASKRQQTTIRSEHRVVRPLTPADLDRVRQTREFMAGFKPVSFEQYRKLAPR